MIDTIVLSAGQSSRMGHDKALLEYNGDHNILHLIRKIENFSSKIYIVLGDNFDKVKEVVSKNDNINKVNYVFNKKFRQGMFSSIKKGCSALDEKRPFFLHMIDQPFVKPGVYQSLIKSLNDKDLIYQPSYEMQAGHPLLFLARFKEIILSYPNSANLKIIINKYKKRRKFVNVNSESILHNINTKKEYYKALEGYKNGNSSF